MITKFRTQFLSVALKASNHLPKEARHKLEHEAQLVINLLSTAFASEETHKKFWELLHIFAHDTIDNCPLHNDKSTKLPCTDWTRGLRTSQGACTNCGEKH